MCIRDSINGYLEKPFSKADILHEFAGMRWLAASKDDIGSTSRGFRIGEHTHRENILMTLYGGKLTAYRHVAETLGNRITKHYGSFVPSKTSDPESWSKQKIRDLPTLKARFSKQ